MATNEKDTIYVDVDDEITTIIDKVRSSPGRIIALVLPKRATVFQSIVNMKLLRRSADAAKKRVVLITSEPNLMPLAGIVGLYVASTPQSKPEIPINAEKPIDDFAEERLADVDVAYTLDNAADRPVGELAQQSGHVVGGQVPNELIVLDGVAADEGVSDVKSAKNKALAVPNFNKFRIRFILMILLVILLIGLYYVGTVILPKGAIAITTTTSSINVSMNLVLDTSAQALDTMKLVAPAKSEQQQKTTSQQVQTTGQKNNGATATGTVTITAIKCGGDPFKKLPTVPSGVAVSQNGLTYITQEDTAFTQSGATTDSNGCYDYPAVNTTKITAQTAGAKYNVSLSGALVVGVVSHDNAATSTGAVASGSATAGTDVIINIVAQTDIDSAKQKLTSVNTDAIKTTLEQALRIDGMYPLGATFNAGTPTITTSANVGDTADTVTVTQAITYTMLGAKQTDLDILIASSLSGQFNPHQQAILDDGLNAATVTVTDNNSPAVKATFQAVATVGPSISAGDVKRQASGKKIGDVKTMINGIPGVTKVDVQLSPFWVSTVPTNPTKVTVTINKEN
jgi:hypothetical protein